MILYHGTNKIFEEFKINKELSNFRYSELMEGLGVYMTTSKEIASGYGQYIYEVEIDDKDIFDSTSKEEMIDIIRMISKRVDFDIESMIDVSDLCDGVESGDISVSELYKEINDLLDSNEELYIRYSDRLTYDDDDLFNQIEEAYLDIIPSVIKYYDKGLGIVYICKKNEEKIYVKSIDTKQVS